MSTRAKPVCGAMQGCSQAIRRQVYLERQSGILFYQRDRALMWASDTHGPIADAFNVLGQYGISTVVTYVSFVAITHFLNAVQRWPLVKSYYVCGGFQPRLSVSNQVPWPLTTPSKQRCLFEVTRMSYVCRWGKSAAKQEAGHHAYDAMLVACGRSPVKDEEFPFMSRGKVPVFDKALVPKYNVINQLMRD